MEIDFKRKTLGKFYLKIFPPFIVSLVIMNLLDSGLFNISLFSLSYFWGVVLKTPFLSEKIWERKNRFSFLRFVFLMDEFLIKSLEVRKTPVFVLNIVRFLPPLFVGVIFILLSGLGNFLYPLFGAVISLFFLMEFKKGFYSSVNSNL